MTSENSRKLAKAKSFESHEEFAGPLLTNLLRRGFNPQHRIEDESKGQCTYNTRPTFFIDRKNAIFSLKNWT